MNLLRVEEVKITFKSEEVNALLTDGWKLIEVNAGQFVLGKMNFDCNMDLQTDKKDICN